MTYMYWGACESFDGAGWMCRPGRMGQHEKAKRLSAHLFDSTAVETFGIIWGVCAHAIRTNQTEQPPPPPIRLDHAKTCTWWRTLYSCSGSDEIALVGSCIPHHLPRTARTFREKSELTHPHPLSTHFLNTYLPPSLSAEMSRVLLPQNASTATPSA